MDELVRLESAAIPREALRSGDPLLPAVGMFPMPERPDSSHHVDRYSPRRRARHGVPVGCRPPAPHGPASRRSLWMIEWPSGRPASAADTCSPQTPDEAVPDEAPGTADCAATRAGGGG